MAKRATYKGKGEYVSGVPARDLSEDEYQALTNEQRDTVRKSELYDVKTDREMHPPARATQEGGEG